MSSVPACRRGCRGAAVRRSAGRRRDHAEADRADRLLLGPPSGPATPVIARPRSAPKRASAPSAIARATWLATPRRTPRSCPGPRRAGRPWPRWSRPPPRPRRKRTTPAAPSAAPRAARRCTTRPVATRRPASSCATWSSTREPSSGRPHAHGFRAAPPAAAHTRPWRRLVAGDDSISPRLGRW